MAGMDDARWKRVVDVSLHGFFHVTQPLLLPMARSRWGRIVSISSVAAVLGNRGQANYAAAKAALHGATRSLAREMASRGITANVVAPGVIGGGMADEAFDAARIRELVPAGRAGTPEEVAAVVGFLCSDAAGYVNGQVSGVHGGMAGRCAAVHAIQPRQGLESAACAVAFHCGCAPPCSGAAPPPRT